MAREKKVKSSKMLANLKGYRQRLGVNQHSFWAVFGVTQSGGSRYENERDRPLPLSMLMVLVEAGKLTEADLREARRIVEAS